MRKTPEQVATTIRALWRGAAVAAEEYQAEAFLAPAHSSRVEVAEYCSRYLTAYAEAMLIVLNPYPRRRS